jgi:hypothetical protein
LRESSAVLHCGISFSAIHMKQENSSIGSIHFLRYAIHIHTDSFLQHRICHNLLQDLLCALLQLRHLTLRNIF